MTENKLPSKKELLDLFINQNLTKQEIADKCGLKLDNIKYLMKKYNIRKKDFREQIKLKEEMTNEQVISKETLRKEADKIVNEILASKGIMINQPTDQVPSNSEQVSTQVNDQVDSFMEELKEEVSDTDIPLDWQPTVNVLTRMYEAGENTYEFVKFYKSKGIIVKLPKKKYNKDIELQKIKFNINSSSFYYDVSETGEYFTISITLV